MTSTFLVPKPRKCPECKGGNFHHTWKYETCEGTGTVFVVHTLGGDKVFPDTREGYARAQAELDSLAPRAL